MPAAAKVPPADDEADFRPALGRVQHFLCAAFAHIGVDAVLAIAHQRFAGDLEKHALVDARGGGLGHGFGDAHRGFHLLVSPP